MCGTGNSYGHPHEETLAKFINADIVVYRTDIHGTVLISTDGQTININNKQAYQYISQKMPNQKTESKKTFRHGVAIPNH